MRRSVPGWNPVAGEGFCTGHDPDRTDMVYLAAESEDQARRLCLACFADEVVADAVVIPRSAIPDRIEVALAVAADELREAGEGDYDAEADALSTLRRLLSGGAS